MENPKIAIITGILIVEYLSLYIMFYTVFDAPTNDIFFMLTSCHSVGDGNFPLRKIPNFVKNLYLD